MEIIRPFIDGEMEVEINGKRFILIARKNAGGQLMWRLPGQSIHQQSTSLRTLIARIKREHSIRHRDH